jgi:hypothetical protein
MDGLLSRDVLDFFTNGLGDPLRDTNGLNILARLFPRTREIDVHFPDHATRSCTNQEDAITKSHGFVNLMRDEHHRRA